MIVCLIFIFHSGNIGSQVNYQSCNGDFTGPCYGEQTFNNTDRYIGQFENKNFNGKGIYAFNRDDEFKGDRYEGDFINGKFSGLGTYFHHNGNKYVGQWTSGKKDGQGTFFFLVKGSFNGDKLEQTFKMGVREGVSIYMHLAENKNKGDRTESNYKNGLKEGEETTFFLNGRKMVSYYHEGKKTGKGFFYDKYGNIVREYWFENDIDRNPNNISKWEIDSKTGCKIFNESPEFNEIVSWSGDCKDGFAQGVGKLTWSQFGHTTEIYKGEMKNGKLEGLIFEIKVDGSRTYGNFNDNKLNGLGVREYQDKRKYVGMFKNYNFDGEGVFFNSKGEKVHSGNWKNGVLTDSHDVVLDKDFLNYAFSDENEKQVDERNALTETSKAKRKSNSKAEKCRKLGIAPKSEDFK